MIDRNDKVAVSYETDRQLQEHCRGCSFLPPPNCFCKILSNFKREHTSLINECYVWTCNTLWNTVESLLLPSNHFRFTAKNSSWSHQRPCLYLRATSLGCPRYCTARPFLWCSHILWRNDIKLYFLTKWSHFTLFVGYMYEGLFDCFWRHFSRTEKLFWTHCSGDKLRDFLRGLLSLSSVKLRGQVQNCCIVPADETLSALYLLCWQWVTGLNILMPGL